MARRTTTSKGDGTLAWLRERNRERVIAVLRTLGRSSQADIARSTGLSRTTVSTLVAELKDSGLVFEVDGKAPDQRGGRPGVQLVLQDSSRAVVGIDFGHSHVQVAAADLNLKVLSERMCELDVAHRAADALAAAARMVEETLAESGIQRSAVVCAGIGIPGPIDRTRGTVGSATILPGWLGLQIANELERLLDLPVEIENDANCGALAELTWGAGRDSSNFAYIKCATGIGAGLVVDGRLLRGASGTAGEIGHTTLDESGALCYCGNRGCLETVASGPAILSLVGTNLTLPGVIALASEGDVRCRRALSDAGREIGIAIAGLCNLINPERIVVGGVLSRAGDLVLDPIRESIRRYSVQAASERVEVVPAVFVERAELLGCLALALKSSSPAVSAPI